MSVTFAERDSDKNRKFLALIEARPCLYNVTLDAYRRLDLREKGWLEIAEEMGDTVYSCKYRWKNIRTVFLRTHRKLGRYYLEEELQFILPYLQVHLDRRHGVSKSKYSKKHSNEENGYTEDSVGIDSKDWVLQTDDDIEKPDFLDPNYDINNIPSDDSYDRPIVKEETSASTTTKRSREHYEDVDDSDLFDTTLEQRNVHESAEQKFLLSLLPDVEEMTAKQKRKFKREVLNLIGRILDDST